MQGDFKAISVTKEFGTMRHPVEVRISAGGAEEGPRIKGETNQPGQDRPDQPRQGQVRLYEL